MEGKNCTYFISVPPFRDRTFCYHQNESKCKTHKKGHDLNYIYNTFILKVKHNFAKLVIYQTNLKSRAGHQQWKKGATTDTDNQQPTTRHHRYQTYRNQQQQPTATPDNKPSALDNRHLTTNNRRTNNQQEIGVKLNAKSPNFDAYLELVQILLF